MIANVVAAVLGANAFAVSFTHVQHLAVRSGQTGWSADSIASSVELMAISAVTEMRRRRRRHQQMAWPRGVLVLGVTMSLAANLAEAQRTVWGCVMAAWPQLAFLAVTGLIETRSVHPVRPEPVRPEPVRPEPVRPEPVRPEPVRPEPVRPEPVRPEPVRPEPVRPEPVRQRGAPDSSAAARRVRTASGGQRPTDDDSADVAADGGAGPAERPSRAAVVRQLCADITANSSWKPNYQELTARTGYGLSWCEKRVSEARRAVEDARRQPYAEAIRTEPPTQMLPTSEHQDRGLASISALPGRATLRPVSTAAPRATPINEQHDRQEAPA